MRILIVEDDAGIARALAAALKAAGMTVDHAVDATDVLWMVASEPFALLVLDLNLPGESGLDLLRRIRAAGSVTPVMILTVRDAVADRVKGLDLGADDYLTKPFELAEFEARVRALLRRGRGLPGPVLKCGGLALDQSTGDISLFGEPVLLRRRERAVLVALVTRAGKVVMKERLAAEVFGLAEEVSPNALELYVGRLRRKLPGGPEIRTVRGLGYLMMAG